MALSIISSGTVFFHVPRQRHSSSCRPFHCSSDNPIDKASELIRPLGCSCCSGGRRHLLLGAPLVATTLLTSKASAISDGPSDPLVLTNVKVMRPPRPDWYEELYAKAMERGMESYEIARYKSELFKNLKGGTEKVLEIGIGTGPNIKYYAQNSGVYVYGVDPNKQMEKYAREAAIVSGLPAANFNFIQGVAEALPVSDDSMDAVIGTIVLCSVNDINTALQEVKRVLKPGGFYIFIEHVAARDGSLLKLLQALLDPLQQFVADGCHLTRETGRNISSAGFSDVQISMTSIPNLSILSPHVYGIAYK